MTRQQLHQLIRESTERLFDVKLKDLETKLIAITKCPSEKLPELTNVINNFKIVYKRKWLACNSTESRFLEKNHTWLNERVFFWPAGAVSTSTKGRPTKEFAEASDRSKRRKTMELRKKVPLDELTYAVQMGHRAAGNKDTAKIIKDITKSPTRATRIRKTMHTISQRTTTKKHTPEEALAIFVEANLSMSQYEVIQQANKDVYPCYKYVQIAKQDCYPARIVHETYGEVKLQDLVDHTSRRLCKYLEQVLEVYREKKNNDFVLVFKWGCDGSRQNQYKQKFQNYEDSDANMFLSSLVPLRLLYDKKVIWQNPCPSSPRFCRPIRMRFVKENNDVTNEEMDYIENQSKNLQKTIISDSVQIKHVLLSTMVDGKVCNAATHTSSTMRCYICNRTSKDFNNLTLPNMEDPETYKFGLSILHARIRLFEFLLHLSYKLKAEVHKGRITVENDKEKIKLAKQEIQKEFREKMGLLVDIPKVGYGNTNDGNTSRRFFSNINLAATITGVDIELIQRFKIILEVLSSGLDIIVENFAIYTMDTAKYYVQLYGWQPMSPTVHKILIHAPNIISHALLPIGQLSEEAAEARNKHFRQYRESFARKFSRTECNEDVLNRLLLTSDPLLSSMRQNVKRNRQSFSKEVLEFLKSAEFEESDE